MRQHALVTGGAGFVGSSLVRILIEQDWQVTVYDRLTPGRADFLPAAVPQLELIEGDILDEELLRTTLQDRAIAVVFHLAAIHYIPYCNAHPLETLRTNVEGTAAVLRACAAANIERVVFTSTAAVYPAQSGPLNETIDPGPADIYGYSKLFGEQLVTWHQHQQNNRCVIARLFNVYGPRETSRHLIPELLDQIVDGATTIALGNPYPKRDYVHVADVARTLYELSCHAAAAPAGLLRVNVGTGVERSAIDVLQSIADVTGRTLRIEQDPTRMRKNDRPHLQADVAQLHTLLGWNPSTDFATGLEGLLDWTMSQRESTPLHEQAVGA